MNNSNSDLIKVDRAEIEQLLQQKPELDQEGAYRILVDRKQREFEERGELPDAREVLKKEQQEIEQQLKDPALLSNILEELSKDHIGDNRQKMFVFCDCCSSRLKPSYRFSCALTGDTSEGKTNLWNTIKKHLPEKWYLDLTRITGAALENLVKEYNLLYFGEGGANAAIIEQVKQFVEDGMSVLKYDTEKDNKEARHDKQLRKVGLFSTTKSPKDKELSSRYCVVSVHGNESKYRKVNEDTLLTAADFIKEIERDERNESNTWIKTALKALEYYDVIVIPYSPLFEVNNKSSRSQRDLKRFLNLIRVITWIHQYQRIRFEHQDKKILVSSPEDLYNALAIGKEIFDQSLSGLEPRLQETIDAYLELRKTNVIPAMYIDEKAKDLDWVERNEIQQELGISRDTIKERTELLSDLNIFRIYYKSNRVYIAFAERNSPTNLPTINPLITHGKKELYDMINAHYPRIVKDVVVGR